MEVRAAETGQLGVLIGEQSSLEKGIIAELDTRHDLGRQEGDLLGFCKEVIHVAVQHQFPDHAERHDFFGDQFGSIEDIKIQLVGGRLIEDLETQFPLGKAARGDGI